MKNLRLFSISGILFFLALAAPGLAEIREVQKMSQTAKEIAQDTLLIFDIDNTILEPAQMLGSDQWFESNTRKLIGEGKDKDAAAKETLKIWERVQRATAVIPVEKGVAKFIRDFQKKGMTVIALTARQAGISKTSLKQLRSVNVSFEKSSPVKKEMPIEGFSNAKHEQGVVFASGQDKGKVLVKFLQQAGISPSKVVLIDDREKNVKNMDTALQEAGIPFIGFRYGAADETVKAFDPAIAEIQLKVFERGVLSDDDAKILREAQSQ